MDTLKTILERRSIRKYTKAPVSREILLQLAKAGMAAPSSRDTRHFRFIIVDDPSLIDELGDRTALFQDAFNGKARYRCGQ